MGFDIPGFTPISESAKTKITFTHGVNLPLCDNERELAQSSSQVTFDSASQSGEISFSIEGWVPVKVKREALVFITGFNCSLQSAIESFGQMLTLGGLSSKIIPFVYKWPGGVLYDYWKAIQITAQEETTRDFIGFLEQLSANGFKNIHLLCHSMGARIITNALPKFDSVFQASRNEMDSLNNSNTRGMKAKLISMTFLNPETPLEEFRSIHFNILTQYTRLITMYGSNNDIALLASEYIFSRKQVIGCHINDMVFDGSRHSVNDIEFHETGSYYLDMDVVDTTHLDINIHAVRHMYFNLNKFVIDDILDLISTWQRASKREHRLVNIGGNVYAFLAAPSYLVK
jgi:hypothetical protein